MELNFFEEKELSAVSISELQGMVRNLASKNIAIDEIESQAKAMRAEADELKQKILSVLAEHNMKSFKVDGVGTVGTINRYSVKWPKDPEHAAKTRQWLIDQGMESMLNLNHMTLNSLYKDQAAQAEGEGRSPIGVIPGLGEPEVQPILSFRKK